MSRRRRPFWVVSALVTVAILGSACADSGYTFVGGSSTNTYFKVPRTWKLFTKQQLLVATNLNQSSESAKSFPMLMAFDGDPHPSIKHVLGDITVYPAVMAQVRLLSPAGQDDASLRALRNAWIPTLDQLLANDGADILSLKQIVLPGGFHGIRFVYNVSIGGNFNVLQGNQVLRVNQISLLDPATRHLYLLVVSCTADCYSKNQTLINQIVDSFTVKEH